MDYRKLGNSGLEVSVVSLGSWLTYGNSVEEKEAAACVQLALDEGINLIDTADVYAQGAAEATLGRILRDVPRKDYVLASKCYFPTGSGPNDRGLSRKHIFESIEASLKRLGTDYLDLYQCHRYDEQTPLTETIRAMDDLIRSGRSLYWGVSCWNSSQLTACMELCEKHAWSRPISNQPPYNMLDRGIEDAVIPTSEELGLSQIVFSPLAQGVLSGKYLPGKELPAGSRAADPKSGQFVTRYLREDCLRAVQELAEIAQERGLALTSLALAWCLRQKNIASVIVGASKREQLAQNLGASKVELDEALLARIQAILTSLPSIPR